MKIFKWFYGFLVASQLSFFLNLTRGSTATCLDVKRKSTDQLIFETAYSEQFKAVPYHFLVGLYFLFADFCCTIAWCFNDLFIVCIAIMLHRDFELFNERIALNLSNKSSTFWNEHFILFKKLCHHVSTTNKLLGCSILLSFGLNLYFICFNLLLNFNISVRNLESVIPWMALIVLCSRTLAVCFFSSKINDESLKTARILHETSCGSNLSEIKAFQNFLSSNKIALSGMGLFTMTKQIILTLSGTIVTYELVLVQFYDREIKAGNLTTCTT
ncbi:hypothetical protein PVAND_009308 [Polypedilum vanderplanki]|uniref:Gustatory receptor n=1 Tax=Polypedilum vanderplanki TaxID=319348 RepID=A0A9J6CD46_POLVA|nr:hypothetical protein PVAND_009308 [Polypedilum vanderplanki]